MRRFDLEFDEGLKVGYKWYDAQNKQPLFPFGFGLSYTTYTYSGLKVSARRGAHGFVTVSNTGKRTGAEVVQIYATLPAAAGEPFQRLVGFDKVRLGAGESKVIAVSVDPKFLSIFNVAKDAWELLPGDYTIHAGPSSRDLPLTATLRIPPANRGTEMQIKRHFVFMTSVLLAASFAFAASDEVKIGTGRLKGVTNEGVVAFKGIPFAAPPVGDLRGAPRSR